MLVSLGLAILVFMLNGYEICLDITNLSISQCARFQLLAAHLHFGLFWSASIPTMYCGACVIIKGRYNRLMEYPMHYAD